MSRIGKPTETGSVSEMPRAEVVMVGVGSNYYWGYVSFWNCFFFGIENVLELHSDDDCTTL